MPLTALALAGGVLCLSGVPAAATAAPCPNEAVRVQQRATALSDCRAYELVTPADKHGYQVGGNRIPTAEVATAADSSRITYTGNFPLPGATVGSFGGFVSESGPEGWLTVGLAGAPGPNQLGGLSGADAALRGTTRDQRVAVYYDNTTAPYGSLWKVDANGVRKRIVDASRFQVNANFGNANGQPWYEGMSADGNHVVFGSTDSLVPSLTPSSFEKLYEWVDDGSNGGAGQIRLVARTNDPAPTLIAPAAHATLGGSPRHTTWGPDGLRNAVSADGSRIFFQTPAPAMGGNGFPQGGPGPVYVRVDGQQTIELSGPEDGHTPVQPVSLYQYLDASLDGRYAFFWADGDLTADAPAGGGIYRYDLDQAQLEFLAVANRWIVTGEPPTAIASDDGSRLYFQDLQSDDADSDWGVKVWHDGDTTTVLASQIAANGNTTDERNANFAILRGLRTSGCASANISPGDGRYMAMTAGVPLTVYRYDAITGELEDLSTTPFAEANAPAGYDVAFGDVGSCGSLGGNLPKYTEARVMSDDGQAVFFSTAAPLVPGDANGRVDAYAWRDGEVSLISTGRSLTASQLAGVDGTGENAFFITEERLVGADPDSQYDIYSARVGGGRFEPGPPTVCEGDGCQGKVEGGPLLDGPGSELLEGGGNADERAGRALVVRGSKARSVVGRAASLRVTVPGRGRVVLSGPGVRRVGRAVGRAGTYRMVVRLSASGRRALARRQRLSVPVAVRFTARSGSPQSKLVRLTFRTSKKGSR